jgi:hypothetical protein
MSDFQAGVVVFCSAYTATMVTIVYFMLILRGGKR